MCARTPTLLLLHVKHSAMFSPPFGFPVWYWGVNQPNALSLNYILSPPPNLFKLFETGLPLTVNPPASVSQVAGITDLLDPAQFPSHNTDCHSPHVTVLDCSQKETPSQGTHSRVGMPTLTLTVDLRHRPSALRALVSHIFIGASLAEA